MLNPIEKFKRSILHLNRTLHHCSPKNVYRQFLWKLFDNDWTNAGLQFKEIGKATKNMGGIEFIEIPQPVYRALEEGVRDSGFKPRNGPEIQDSNFKQARIRDSNFI